MGNEINLQTVSVMNLKPDDILVLRYKERLTYEKRQEIHSLLRTLFPAHNALVLDNGTDIGVTRLKAES